jgi:hypothetical protein
LELFDLIIPNKIFVVFYMIFIGIVDYKYFIKNKVFLEKNFKTDKKGGFLIISFIILNCICLIYFANKNREKVYREREKARMENIE